MNIYIKKESTFNYICSGEKKIEGRLYKGIFKNIKINDIVLFSHKKRTIKVKILELKIHSDFEVFLSSEKLSSILPGVNNINEGLRIYKDYYHNNNNEVIAIKFIIIS